MYELVPYSQGPGGTKLPLRKEVRGVSRPAGVSARTLRVRPPDLYRYAGALRRLTIRLGGIKLRLARAIYSW